MVRARLTSKGQITLPVELRRRYDLQAGDDVEFVMEEKEARLRPVKRRKASDFYGVFEWNGPAVSKRDAREAVAGFLADDDERIRRGDG